jgi:hypothetical protein
LDPQSKKNLFERFYLETALRQGGCTMMCRHCQKVRANRPRGLCWSCYYNPEIRARYPSTSKYGRRGLDDFSGPAPLPSTPTQALPGTPEKIAVLAERARLRQELWHPLDATLERPAAALSQAS